MLRSPGTADLPGTTADAPPSPAHFVLSSPQLAVRQGVDPDSFRSVRHCFSSSSQTRFLHNVVSRWGVKRHVLCVTFVDHVLTQTAAGRREVAFGPKSPVRLHVFSIAPKSPVHSVLSPTKFAVEIHVVENLVLSFTRGHALMLTRCSPETRSGHRTTSPPQEISPCIAESTRDAICANSVECSPSGSLAKPPRDDSTDRLSRYSASAVFSEITIFAFTSASNSSDRLLL